MAREKGAQQALVLVQSPVGFVGGGGGGGRALCGVIFVCFGVKIKF